MTFRVYGTPAPQGSKRHLGHGVMIESSKKVKPWREAVKYAFLEARPAGHVPMDQALHLFVWFYLPRPKSAKLGAVPTKKPDLDKLTRCTMDGLTEAGLWSDDSRVTKISAAKIYAGGEEIPGALIEVRNA